MPCLLTRKATITQITFKGTMWAAEHPRKHTTSNPGANGIEQHMIILSSTPVSNSGHQSTKIGQLSVTEILTLIDIWQLCGIQWSNNVLFSVQVTFYLLNKFGQNTKISYITIRASEADIPPCMPPTPSKKMKNKIKLKKKKKEKNILHSAPTNVGILILPGKK